MSQATAVYRIRIAAAGASTIGTPDLVLTQADITETPILSGPSVEPLAGRTVSMPFRVRCTTDDVLFAESGRLTGLGRLAEIQRSVDGGAFVTIGTGRISHMAESARGGIDVSVSDESWQTRQAEIFATTDTVQLHPPGLDSAWYGHPARGTLTYSVLEVVSADVVKIGPGAHRGGTSEAAEAVPIALRRALATDLVAPELRDGSATNSDGNFTSLRFRYSGADHRVISFRSVLGGAGGGLSHNGLLGDLAVNVPGGGGPFGQAFVYIASHGLSVGNTVEGRFYWLVGVAVTEGVPLHIGGTSGVHPMALLKDILDGDYGGEPVRYDPTAMSALEALSMRNVWARITEPADRAKWVQKNVYAAFMVAPLIATDLNIHPTSLRVEQNLDPDTLTALGASDVSGLTWGHSSREMVTVVSWTSQTLIPWDEEAGSETADLLDALPQKLPDIEHDTAATLGKVYHTIETELIFADDHVFRIATELAGEIFGVFGDGPARGLLTVSDQAGVQVGDLVIIDQDTLKGYNPEAAARTGDRVVRLLGFNKFTPASITFEYLDAGPNAVALAAPTVSVAQDGTDLELIDVTLSNIPSGARATVELEIAAFAPTTFTYVRANQTDGVTTFRVPNPTDTAFARAKSVQPGRISSDWATDDVALTEVPRITARVSRPAGGDVRVSWTELSGTAGVRIDYDAHPIGQPPTFANAADFDVADGTALLSGVVRQDQAFSVRLTPYPTFSGGAVSGTPGEAVVLVAYRPRPSRDPRGRPTDPEDRTRRRVSGAAIEFDADGHVRVLATGDSQTRNIYVTVGDGTTPADPTASVNDGAIVGEFGSVDTGISITADNDAVVKVVTEDLLGDLSEVVTLQRSSSVASERFTAASPVFTGSTTIKSGQGGNRHQFVEGTGNRGAFYRLYSSSDAVALTVSVGLSDEGRIEAIGALVLESGAGDIEITPSGVIDIAAEADTGKVTTDTYLPIKVNGITRYLLLYGEP